MTPHHLCLALLFAVPILSSKGIQPIFAANLPQATIPAEPIQVLTLTAGATLDGGYKIFKGENTPSITYVLYDETGSKEANLPPGLTFGGDGIIRGTVPPSPLSLPTVYTLKLFNGNENVSNKKIVFKINPALNASTETVRLTAGSNITIPIYPFKISGGTGKTEIAYLDKNNIQIRQLDGLFFEEEGGITGNVPTNEQILEGVQTRITDEGGAKIVRTVPWNINPPMTATVTNPSLLTDSDVPPGLFPIKVSGGTPALRFKLFESDRTTPATLPSGIEFNEITGGLAGRVNIQNAMKKNYVVKVMDQGGGVLTTRFQLTINKTSP